MARPAPRSSVRCARSFLRLVVPLVRFCALGRLRRGRRARALVAVLAPPARPVPAAVHRAFFASNWPSLQRGYKRLVDEAERRPARGSPSFYPSGAALPRAQRVPRGAGLLPKYSSAVPVSRPAGPAIASLQLRCIPGEAPIAAGPSAPPAARAPPPPLRAPRRRRRPGRSRPRKPLGPTRRSMSAGSF